VDETTLRFLIGQVPTAALAIVFLWLFITGRIHSSAEFDRARQDYLTEKAAHEQTKAALAIASARADAGVRAAELVASAVEGARHVPPAHAPQ
jgi:hypothetical protein